jgi:hypothetical protein
VGQQRRRFDLGRRRLRRRRRSPAQSTEPLQTLCADNAGRAAAQLAPIHAAQRRLRARCSTRLPRVLSGGSQRWSAAYAHGVLECALEISGRNLRQCEARDELCATPGALRGTLGYHRRDEICATACCAKPGLARRIHRPRRRPGFKGRAVDVVRLELRNAARACRRDPCGRACKHGGTEARARDRRREPVDLIRSRLGCRRLASEACAGADASTEGLPSTNNRYSEFCRYGTGPAHGNRADALAHECVQEPVGRRRSFQCSPSRAAPGFQSHTALARTCVVTAPARGRQRLPRAQPSNRTHRCARAFL